MRRRMLVCLALLSAAGAKAATSGFLLGLDYTEWGPFGTQQMAADASGALYILSLCAPTPPDSATSPSCVTKVSADGKSILWQNNLGFTAAAMAVDPGGGVYAVTNVALQPDYTVFVEKLSADGTSVSWKTQLGAMQPPTASGVSIAVDSTGRVFAAGAGMSAGEVVRLNAAGAVDAVFSNPPANPPVAIAVDPAGSDVVVALETSTGWSFARLAPDGSTWVSFTPPQAMSSPVLAVAGNGDAVMYGEGSAGNWLLQRVDSTGAAVFSEAVPGGAGGLALDAAGNAYVLGGGNTSVLYPVRNSLAPCGSVWLSVFAPDGSLLQTTYLPGDIGVGPIATSLNSTVFVLGVPNPAASSAQFTPTQTGPFPEFPYGAEYGSSALLRLSPNASAPTLPLVCVGNAATFGTGPVAPGEMVTLFGNGLGPQQGIQTTATLQSPFPTQAGNVEVTFDGTPAPLLWVQDAQINLAVPWSVAGPTTQVCVTYNNVPANCLTWPVAEAAPGVFTVDGVYAAALNQDGTVNSAANPAPLNSVVSIFATGLGPINPPQADGALVGLPLPVNALPVELAIPPFDPTPCDTFPPQCPVTTYAAVAYGGPAPFLMAGISQINFNASDVLNNGGPSAPFLLVKTPSGTASFSGNAFRIYVAGVPNQ